MKREAQIESLAAAINEALSKAAEGSNYDDCCITLNDDGSFEYWNSLAAYSNSIDPDRIAVERAWDLGGDYEEGDGRIYAEAFIDEILTNIEAA